MNARTCLVSVTALASFAACGRAVDGPPAPSAAAPAVAIQPVVYGEDGSTEWFSFPDEAVRLQTRASVAAMVPWDSVYIADDGAVVLDSYAPLGAANGLCADQRFWDQATSASCSGTLIDDQLLLTAGHCVTDLGDCADNAWVFDYLYDADGVRAPITADAVYRCVDLVVASAHDTPSNVDVALVQLDRPVNRTPAAVAAVGPVAKGDPLILPGFPSGIPLKIDGGGLVAEARANQGDYFVAAIDAYHGNSGSGVLDSALAVVGVLSDGAEDYQQLDSCAVVNVLDPDDAEESVIYAHHAVTALCAKGYPSAALCGLAAQCGDGFCTDGETAADCPGDCTGLFAVPAEWACNPAYFDAFDGCDCACGALDPDCGKAGQQVYGCAPGSGCEPDATCTAPLPEGWTCNASRYGSGGQCDCDCGAYDPDCDTSSQVSNCAPGGTCQPDGTCTLSIPAAWTCRDRWYAADDGCDCGCGAWDPDCEDSHQQIYNCVPGSGCLSDGTCEVPLPAGWVCDPELFAAGDGCDCNCGALDPDCDGDTAALNCAAGLVCGAAGGCV
ncbi:MAG: hypothetical protein CVU56_16230, partial [Deltaproteobacteria bacterium HGW-Deltaproteobacteria-14]